MPATTATLHGVLNPGKEGEPGTYETGTYEFLYKASTKKECEGEGKAPASPGISLGAGKEEVTEGLSGLLPNTAYAVCLRAETAGGATVGPAVTFTTALPPETPEALKAQPIAATTATLHGVLNPKLAGNAGIYEFLYRESSSKCQGEGGAATPATASAGSAGEAVEAPVTGLQPGMAYTFCLLARNAAGESALGGPVTFTTLAAAPVVEGGSEAVKEVTASSATFLARIDPAGAETTYHFEYVPQAQFEESEFAQAKSTPESVSIGADDSGHPASAHVQGLQAATLYHYRVAATNSVETAYGPDLTFTTHMAGGEFALPDGRQWEMVTPQNMHGSGIESTLLGEATYQAAEDGNGITYGADGPIVANPGGNPAVSLTQVLSTRGPHGWESKVINPPTEDLDAYAQERNGFELAFSSDLSLALVAPNSFTPLPPLPPGAEKTGYLRKNTECESTAAELVPATCYLALVTAANTEGAKWPGGLFFQDATPDLSHIVFNSREKLTPNAVEGPEEGMNIYEWSAGKIELIGLGAYGNGAGYSHRHAISSNGNRVVWELNVSDKLVLSDMARKETVPLDPEPTRTQLQTASSDGTRVFFNPVGYSRTETGDLYVLEAPTGEPLTAAHMTDLSPGTAVQTGAVLGASENGCNVSSVGDNCYVYFMSSDKLYMVHYDESSAKWEPPKLIVRLDGSLDSQDWDEGSFPYSLNKLSAEVSPNGRFVAFMSSRGLTGYDNTDVNESSGRHSDQEVYLYDAQTGRLACASCNPTGARPAGLFDLTGGNEEPLVDNNASAHQSWENQWLGGSVPQGWEYSDAYQPRYLSNDGRLFFNGADALVPADVNGVEDVYEYEPEGVGPAEGARCGPGTVSASEVFKPAVKFEVEGVKGEEPAGCVGLISSGSSPQESAFVDASAGGGDVFFMSTAHLTSEDIGSAYEIFDAHECSSSSPCATPLSTVPACTTADSCRVAPSPQPAIFGAPSSQTFSGAGNVTPASTTSSTPPRKTRCARGRKLSHGRCVKRKSGKRPGKARRAGRDRRAKS